MRRALSIPALQSRSSAFANASAATPPRACKRSGASVDCELKNFGGRMPSRIDTPYTASRQEFACSLLGAIPYEGHKAVACSHHLDPKSTQSLTRSDQHAVAQEEEEEEESHLINLKRSI